MGGVVTLGETMGLLTPPPAPRLRDGAAMTLGIGGAESNVAIALARLGVDVTWISRVGDDDLGDLVVRELRAEGVEVRAVVDPEAPTGLMLKERRGERITRVRYYRGASAASRLGPSDVDARRIGRADVLHVTGITPALGPGPRAAVERAVDVARAHGTLVSFDVNHRSALWPAAEAGPVLGGLAKAADVVFASAEEAGLLLGVDLGPADDFEEGERIGRTLVAAFGGTAVVKLGALGAVAVEGDVVDIAPTTPVEAADPVGAGDAFVGGYLAALVEGRCVADRLELGNRVAGAVCRVPGDWEGLPTRAELATASPLEITR